ncbi:hypothetical protein CISIN_1g039118mg [Citrus sinensis]|uniref:Hydrophobic seed protein domain-containing protein n=1 Tax=Citrus sinensis TaxID=2711 RepID=A0A067D0L0_CITSI|nr:hypothetical protein CISIN_1g039118mg [Citrus sinensis]
MASKGSKSKAIRLPINLMFFILLASIPSSAAEQTACSGNFMELEECVDVFRALSRQRTPSKNFCCSLIGNMVQLEAMGTCLCTALEDIVLDVIKREIPSASLCLLWNYCESEIPPDFQCINVPSHGSM